MGQIGVFRISILIVKHHLLAYVHQVDRHLLGNPETERDLKCQLYRCKLTRFHAAIGPMQLASRIHAIFARGTPFSPTRSSYHHG